MSDEQQSVAVEGGGVLVVRFDGRSSVVLRIEARYPLKLLHQINRHAQLPSTAALQAVPALLPRLPAHLPPVVQMVGYGGGLLRADRLSLNVHLMPHASLLLTTPANGRVYKQHHSTHLTSTTGSELRHTFHVGPSSLLLFVPSPVSLFARSSLATHSTLHLHREASLLLLDVITSGRSTQGEQFGQSQYSATTTVYYTDDNNHTDRVPTIRDRTVFGGEQHDDDAATVGSYKARGTVLLLGPQLLPLAVQLYLSHNQRGVRKKKAQHAEAGSGAVECVVSAAWVCGNAPELVPADCVMDTATVERCLSGGQVSGGCLLRLMSGEVDQLLQTVSRLLTALDSHMQGVAPWQRV